jgi:hypothetical protein
MNIPSDREVRETVGLLKCQKLFWGGDKDAFNIALSVLEAYLSAEMPEGISWERLVELISYQRTDVGNVISDIVDDLKIGSLARVIQEENRSLCRLASLKDKARIEVLEAALRKIAKESGERQYETGALARGSVQIINGIAKSALGQGEGENPDHHKAGCKCEYCQH